MGRKKSHFELKGILGSISVLSIVLRSIYFVPFHDMSITTWHSKHRPLQKLVYLLLPIGKVDRDLHLPLCGLDALHGRRVVLRNGPHARFLRILRRLVPRKQVTLLLLYDEPSLPHMKKKQLFVCMLDIIS